MNDLNRLRKYFIYEDTLRTVVSLVSGIFIVIFNTFSGIVVSYIFAHLIFENYAPNALNVLILIIPGIISGACLLKLCLLLIDVLLTGTEVDNYSYVRLLLLASVSLYLLILILYSLFIIASFLETKFL